MTDHVTEYFPMTKKVVARTARDWQSIIFSANAHPDSTASENPAPALPSRFSSSTEGSAPLPSRFSTSTEGSAQPHTSYDEDAEDAEDEDEEADPDEDGMLNAPDDESDDETGMGKKPHGRKWIKGGLIGTGSFGQVYLGMDGSTGLLMAVKQVELPTRSAPNQEKLSALEREIELLKDLQHENIVQYLYSLLDDKYLNVFLEYIPGGSVATLLRNYGAFEEPLVRDFVRQILEGLNYLHERDIIHCDINGANILVDNTGGIKICSFGISKKVGDSNLLTSNHMHSPLLQGSAFCMAPEVVKQGTYTLKADIWSVGCLAVEMLIGEHPWAPLTQMQAIFKIGSSAKPTIPSDISSDAQDFLMRTFELDREARPSAAELLLHAWVCTEDPAPFLPSRFRAVLETIEGFRKSLMFDFCLPLFATAEPRLHRSK